jgi:hypothetical protein
MKYVDVYGERKSGLERVLAVPKLLLMNRVHSFCCRWLLGALVVAGSGAWAQAGRTELDLSGTWQYQKDTQLLYPPTNTWQTTTVPGYLTGWQYEHAWFRRTFLVPAAMSGSYLKLRFGGAKFNSQVWLNGIYVGNYANGYEPFEMDVSAMALVGQTNELVVGVTDWTATFAAPVDFSNMGPYESPRDHVRNNILAPIGGRYDLYGIWQPVKLVALPAASIADVFVMPSVRTQQLTVRVTVRNDSAVAQSVTVSNRVLDGASVAVSLPQQALTVPAGTNAQFDLTVPWPNAHYWTHLDPYLYSLETTLTGAAGQDLVNTRFGFREFWVTGGQFYLNGTPINMLASATWPAYEMQTSNQIAKVLLDVKNGNNVALRLHTQPWDEPWYDIADKLGLLIIEEAAVWCDPWAYKLSDTNFWNSYSQHLSAAVKRDRNHPSIVMWSLENEILSCGGERAYSATDVQLAAMGRVVKGLDPTRPITYESDLDPGGEATALGLHYPHEFPDYQLWPNAAYWMNQSIPRDWVPGGQWTWDRTKPLYIGEFLWVPSTSAADFTILFGDDAYADPNLYRNLAKGMTWRMQIEAYRNYGVNGMSPWTMFEDPAVSGSPFDIHPESNYLYQVQKAAYHPNAVVVQEYNSRFFIGATVPRTLHIYNDRMTSGNFTLRWSADGSSWQTRVFSLPPAGQRQENVTFPVPGNVGPFGLRLELSNGGTVVFTNTILCSALAPAPATGVGGLKVGLYDPRGTTGGLLNRFGVSFLSVTNLRTAAYDQLDLLMIGRDALTNEPMAEVGPDTLTVKWQNFAWRGGWVWVLEQTNYPSWMPAELRIASFDATFAFPNPDHPVTRDLVADDLRWWANDHRLVAKALLSPARGNSRVQAWVGSRSGLEYAAAAEVPIGNGGILCSQWLLTERIDLEPMAGVLFQRTLAYCASSAGHLRPRPAALLGEPGSAPVLKLTELGLQAENFSGRLASCDPALYPLLVVAGTNAAWQEATAQLSFLTNYVQRGGKLVLHRPPASFLGVAQPVLFPELGYSDAALGLILRRDASNAAVRLTSHDLYWIEQSGDWNRPELLSTNIAGRYYRKQFNLTSYATIQAETMPIHTTGGSSPGGWLLWANGYIAQNINVASPGTYLFNVKASGTPALGGWPQMTLKIDGRAQDSITVPSTVVAYYTLSADLTPGVHQLAISFDNDAYAPPEDRNLFVDEIRWGREAEGNPATLLSRPGAVAQVRRGNGLVVLDEIAWDSETKNGVKAGRFASSLLTGLGASMRLPQLLRIEAEAMTNINVVAYQTNNGITWLYSNGHIDSAARFTTAGYYTFEILAGGTPMQGVLPQVGILIDNVSRTNFFLTSTGMTRYAFSLNMSAGVHRLGLAFLNDNSNTNEDRNLSLDWLTITPPTPPRIVSLAPDLMNHLATLQWETAIGKNYEVQLAPVLGVVPGWQAVTSLISPGTIASWQDNGALSGAAPFTPSAPQRFYRVRQVGP